MKTGRTVLESRIHARVSAMHDSPTNEPDWISKACKRGRVHTGCSDCYSLKCACDCHRKIKEKTR